MKLSHKRKVKLKLNKSRSTLVMSAVAAKKPVAKTVAKPVAEKPVAKKAEPAQSQVAVTSDIALTPKQQQVLDILRANPEGINPKGIGSKQVRKMAKLLPGQPAH